MKKCQLIFLLQLFCYLFLSSSNTAYVLLPTKSLPNVFSLPPASHKCQRPAAPYLHNRKLEEELAKAHSEIIKVRNQWFEVFEDLQKESEKHRLSLPMHEHAC